MRIWYIFLLLLTACSSKGLQVQPKDDFDKIVALMPTDSEFQTQSREHMIGIAKQIQSVKTKDQTAVDTLKMYLDEMDRRRNKNWREIFPWLIEQ